ncbi:MAG: 50S ribosomal protein L9 [Candidatus Nitrohelix vancouverensis]|uniref:Large ribosomal subunit protein bL9 n=1 Tax=Candidatus Nitrohelix vancouverensis TaxID=2705534 RepID=A0A7T0G4C3_9BACT|nr:MAG: 50S ribosomal protein L9 [Candidatus Nitrohelix vancouverensis]
MKLLLKEDVGGLGICGDEVEVKDGYGRNYLVPQGKAILATPKNMKQFNHQKSIVQARVKKAIVEAEERAKELSALSCVITKKVGDQGKLFGAVTAQDIADCVHALGAALDRKKIQMGDPIKTLGDFQVVYKLHPKVTAQIKVSVVAENVVEEVSAEATEEATEEKNEAEA